MTPDPAVQAGETLGYWAFISYSHADKAWGDWLHKGLETFPVPKDLRGTEGPLGTIPKRLFPVFRDREELPTSSDLATNITQALAASRTLVVLCSPRSAASRWVNEEILQYKRLGRADRILCVIVSGEPNASEAPSREGEECFPEALRFALDDQGRLTATRTEPIAADARPQGDGKRDALLKVVAGILGVPFDKLRKRDEQRRKRRMVMFSSVAIALIAIMGTLTVMAVRSERRARESQARALFQRDRATAAQAESDRQKRLAEASEGRAVENASLAQRQKSRAELKTLEAQKSQAAMMFQRAHTEIAANRTPEAIAWLTSLLRLTPQDGASMDRLMTLFSQRRRTLPEAVLREPGGFCNYSFDRRKHQIFAFSRQGILDIYDLKKRTTRSIDFKIGDGVRLAVFSPDHASILVVRNDHEAWLLKVATEHSHPIRVSVDEDGFIMDAEFCQDGSLLAVGGVGISLQVFSGVNGTPVSKMLVPQRTALNHLRFSPDGSKIISMDLYGKSQIWQTGTGRAASPPFLLNDEGRFTQFRFNKSGTRVIINTLSQAHVWDLITGKQVGKPIKDLNFATFLENDQHIFSVGSNGSTDARDAETGALVRDTNHFSKDGPMRAVDASGKYFAVATGNKIHIGDLEKGTTWNTLSPGMGDIEALQFTENGRWLLCRSVNKVYCIYDHLTKKQFLLPFAQIESARAIDEDRIMALMKNGDLALYKCDHQSLPMVPLSRETAVEDIALRQDGSFFTLGSDGQVRSWSPDGGASALTPIPKQFGAKSLVLDRHRNALFIGGLKASLWDISSGSSLSPPADEGKDGFYLVRYNPSGRTLLSWSAKRMRFRDLHSGNLLAELPVPRPRLSPSFSPDGHRVLIASSDHQVRILDSKSGREICPALSQTESIRSASFSPDGSEVMTAGSDSRIRIYDAISGSIKQSRRVTSSEIISANYDAAGARIVLVCRDRTVQVCDARSLVPTMQPLSFATDVKYAAFHGQNESLAIVTDDFGLQFWDPSTGVPLSEPLQVYLHGRDLENDLQPILFPAPGTHFITWESKECRLWNLGLGLHTPPEWYLRLCEAVVGCRLNERMVVIPIADSLKEINEITTRHILSANPKDPFVKWARYILHMDPQP